MSGESEPSILCTSVSRTQFVLLIRPLGLVSFVISAKFLSLSISKRAGPSQVSAPSASSKSLADKIALPPGAIGSDSDPGEPSASPLQLRRFHLG